MEKDTGEIKLIINADDAGLADEINKAVRRCLQEGLVTGVSVMAPGRSFKQLCEMLHVINRTSVGVHLTVTGGFEPCCADTEAVDSLLDEGKFRGGYTDIALALCKKEISGDDLYREFTAQVEKIRKEGLEITHLDSHEHIHMFPGVLDTVLKVAVDNGIGYIRFPSEHPLVMARSFSGRDVLRFAALKAFIPRARKKIKDAGLKCNDSFWGHFHSGRLGEDTIDFILQRLRPGVNEMCVHPAFLSEDFIKAYPWYRNAGGEMESLVGRALKDKIRDLDIRLVSQGQV